MSSPDFFTPIIGSSSCLQLSQSYLQFGQNEAHVVSEDNGRTIVHLQDSEASCCGIIFRAFLIITIIVPLLALIAHIAFRCCNKFTIEEENENHDGTSSSGSSNQQLNEEDQESSQGPSSSNTSASTNNNQQQNRNNTPAVVAQESTPSDVIFPAQSKLTPSPASPTPKAPTPLNVASCSHSTLITTAPVLQAEALPILYYPAPPSPLLSQPHPASSSHLPPLLFPPLPLGPAIQQPCAPLNVASSSSSTITPPTLVEGIENTNLSLNHRAFQNFLVRVNKVISTAIIRPSCFQFIKQLITIREYLTALLKLQPDNADVLEESLKKIEGVINENKKKISTDEQIEIDESDITILEMNQNTISPHVKNFLIEINNFIRHFPKKIEDFKNTKQDLSPLNGEVSSWVCKCNQVRRTNLVETKILELFSKLLVDLWLLIDI